MLDAAGSCLARAQQAGDASLLLQKPDAAGRKLAQTSLILDACALVQTLDAVDTAQAAARCSQQRWTWVADACAPLQMTVAEDSSLAVGAFAVNSQRRSLPRKKRFATVVFAVHSQRRSYSQKEIVLDLDKLSILTGITGQQAFEHSLKFSF
eukprot:TRINITY_DN3203_c0_g5_i1.p2 TRINITY_DN3203_c0_g5~~TRINITY_DN3203_c0_g5_i1.p2  ORF type:complete len:152 (-),score=20.79 TRINITY_DN3203_c0_g5_i1:552-1007(-)